MSWRRRGPGDLDRPPNPDQSSPAGVAGVGTLVLLAFIGATMWTLRRRAGVSRGT